MKGRTLCPMGDAAAFPVLSMVEKFGRELGQAMPRKKETGTKWE
jgi:hypothetical protein